MSIITCEGCQGTGRLITECCNGHDGCSCKGGLVDVGICRVCNGHGYTDSEHCDMKANVNYLKFTGACFAGSGPTKGYWQGKTSLNGNPL